MPPLVVKNMVILGPATNEMGANCWVGAFDIEHREGTLESSTPVRYGG